MRNDAEAVEDKTLVPGDSYLDDGSADVCITCMEPESVVWRIDCKSFQLKMDRYL